MTEKEPILRFVTTGHADFSFSLEANSTELIEQRFSFNGPYFPGSLIIDQKALDEIGTRPLDDRGRHLYEIVFREITPKKESS